MKTLNTTMTGTAKQSRKSKRHLSSTLFSRIPDTCRNANEAATTLGRLISQNVVQEYMLRFKSRRDQHRDHGDSIAEDFVSSLFLDEVYERSNLPGSIAILTSFFDGLVYEVSKQEKNMILSRNCLEQVRPTSLLQLKVFFAFHSLNLKCRKRLFWIGTNGLLILCPNQIWHSCESQRRHLYSSWR